MKPLRNPFIYIDDSGDGGFKIGKGSSSYFVLAACVFKEGKELEHLSSVMNECALRNRLKLPEFKYSKLKNRAIADELFDLIEEIDFSVRILEVEKSRIWSRRLRGSSAEFKTEMHRQLLTHFHGVIHGAKVFIDGRDGVAAGMSEASFYKQCADLAAPGSVSQVRFVDSRESRPIQLADMIAGSARRMAEAKGSGRSRAASSHFATYVERTWQRNYGSHWKFGGKATS